MKGFPLCGSKFLPLRVAFVKKISFRGSPQGKYLFMTVISLGGTSVHRNVTANFNLIHLSGIRISLGMRSVQPALCRLVLPFLRSCLK